MNSKQNPFSLYDFLGYLIPGALVLYFGFIAYAHLNAHAFDQDMLKEAFEPFRQGGYDLYLPFIIVAYILGHLISFVSAITVEKYTNWMNGYPSKYLLGIPGDGFFHAKKNRFQRCIGRSIVFLILVPFTIPDLIIGKILNLQAIYIKSMSKASRAVAEVNIRKLFEPYSIDCQNPEDWFHDISFFRYCYHYAYEHSVNHGPKMQNYVALFGFCRTMTLIFVMFFWIFLIHTCAGKFGNPFACWSLTGTAFLSYIFFIAFNKFYRRYSLEALMALATLRL